MPRHPRPGIARPVPSPGSLVSLAGSLVVRVCWLTAAFLGPFAAASPLDERITVFNDAVNQTPAQVSEILQLGLQENRSAAAFHAVRSWLADNPVDSPPLLHHAAQSAERAGEGQLAIGFYRKLLSNPAVEAGIAAEAVPAAWRLLINHLGDSAAAYQWMSEQGNALRVHGRASQFDSWFLNQARTRGDVTAVCERLTAMNEDRGVDFARHIDSLDWLVGKFESFRFENEAWYPAALKLAEAGRIPEPYRARIAWAATVIPYNRALDEARNEERPVDPTFSDAPLAAAARLLRALPNEGALLVAQGWGVEYDHGHSGNCQRRFEIEGERKLAQLFSHLPRMAPERRHELLAFRIAQGRVGFDRAAVRKFIIDNPGTINSLTSGDVPIIDEAITEEEIRALAPQLSRHIHPEAALVRAHAAGARTASAAIARIFGHEAWRFSDPNIVIDSVLRSHLFENDVPREELAKRHPNLGPSHEQFQQQTAPEGDSARYLQAFNALFRELKSNAPTIPSALALWDQLFKNATGDAALNMLRTLATNPDREQEFLLHRAIANARFNGNGHFAWQANTDLGNHFRHHRIDQEFAADFHSHIRNQLAAQLGSGEISANLFGIWLFAANPADQAHRDFMAEIAKSAAYEKLGRSYEIAASNALLFDHIALTPRHAATHPLVVSSELLGLGEDAAPNQIEAAFARSLDRAAKSPDVIPVMGLRPVAGLEVWSPATLDRVLSLFGENAPIGGYPNGQGYDQIIVKLTDQLAAAGEWGRLEPHATSLWLAAGAVDDARSPLALQALVKFTENALAAEQTGNALSLALAGTTGSTGGGLVTSPHETFRQQGELLQRFARQAAEQSGIAAVTVDASNPAFPIYQSQAEFISGNLDSAWLLYSENADRLEPVLRDLSIAYVFWLLQRNLEEDRNEVAEQLVRELTIWSRQAEGSFTNEQSARLRIAFAELSLRKGNLDTARAWYRQIADAAAYRGSAVHLEAALGSVRVDRISRNFAAAINELDALMQIDDPAFRLASQAARAEVLMDQENFAEALREIEAVLRAKPRDPDALILRGKIQYEMRKLVEASEIEVGPSVDETVLVPGETLKINLRDPSLSVSGLGADIEVEVWSSSGDRERVLLAPFGDSRERLRAEIPTALGAPVAGDRVLQVLGDDQIRFGYSKEFRQRMKDLPPDPETVITVASDASLAMSAAGFPPREGERRLSLEELGISTAQATLGARSVRPGNPVYIRLVDPDQSKNPAPDKVFLNLFTSSGDEIRRLELLETGPFTGEFQAIVPTAPATATAFASESAPGRDPNMAISSKDYPGWLGDVGEREDARFFGVDLNDDAAIHRMQINTGGEALTHFVVQTSMNGIDWTTRGRLPAEAAPWDGRPQITSFPTYRGGIAVPDPEDRNLPDPWLSAMEVDSARPSCNYLSAHIPNLTAEELPVVDTGHPGYSGLVRFRAMFHQPAAAVRRFRLEDLPFQDDKGTIRTLFLINGTPASEESEDPHTIERELAPGLHTIEVWHHGSRAEFLQRKPRILCDQPGQAELVPCPDEMFDPATFPEAVRASINHSATVSVPEGGDAIEVAFHESTRARLVRLAIFGFDGLAPRIDRVTLVDRNDLTLLPIEEDFMQLRQNNQLEVLPGDTITARYEDPVSATPNRILHEQRLRAAFNDGSIAVSFLTYETNADGERVFVPQPIRRFRFDDALTVLINDADLDLTAERDTVEFTVTNSDGASITLEAVETTENSGSFMGRFFPVESEPSRDSEIQLKPGASLTLVYRDTENLTPGIPTDRSTTINHAQYQLPAFAVYSQSSEPLEAVEAIPANQNQPSWMPQPLSPRRGVDYEHRGEDQPAAKPASAVLGAPLRFDVVAPHLALTGTSEIHAFVQTESARQAAGITDGTFNINVPGTLRVNGSLSSPGLNLPPGYALRNAPTPPTNAPALEEGRFAFAIPVSLGSKPGRSYANREARDLPASEIPTSVAANEGETIHVGYPWQDPEGKVHWKISSFRIESHAFLEVMQSGYTEPLESLYIGERAYLRLTAPGLSRSDENDTATVTLTAAGGTTADLELYETEPHSGIFTGSFEVRIARQDESAEGLPPVASQGFPAGYGDTITVTHADQSHAISINLGADGAVEPFTKRFTGDEMAVQTSFVLAESYFELAKKHNEMEEESLARRQIGQAHRLLAEAVANHHDQNLKAHAEYLLGNLAMEFAELARNEEARTPMYQDALSRFTLITDDFPDSEFAPKAQLKIAQTYELMGETASSIEEYVKLAYKYPDHELIPTVMARLGAYFQKTGQTFKDQADPLREKTDPESIAEVIRLDELATAEFLKAANVYAKLERRFPDDPLTGVSSLAAAQNYMRAHHYDEAIAQFQRVIDNQNFDGPSLRSQALYWAGLSHERLMASYSEDNWRGRGISLTAAYQLYRRVTFDFPDSNWAKFARGRLADPAFERIVREEAEKRARMIEALKEQR